MVRRCPLAPLPGTGLQRAGGTPSDILAPETVSRGTRVVYRNNLRNWHYGACWNGILVRQNLIETKWVRRKVADRFRAHDPKHGARLEQIQALGRRGGLAGRVREIPAGRVEAGDANAGAVQIALSADVGERGGGSATSARVWPVELGGKPSLSPDLSGGEAQARPAGVNRGGRPAKYKGVPPWEKAGVSKATYFRRLKAGTL
jgi:hypothetical protein